MDFASGFFFSQWEEERVSKRLLTGRKWYCRNRLMVSWIHRRQWDTEMDSRLDFGSRTKQARRDAGKGCTRSICFYLRRDCTVALVFSYLYLPVKWVQSEVEVIGYTFRPGDSCSRQPLCGECACSEGVAARASRSSAPYSSGKTNVVRNRAGWICGLAGIDLFEKGLPRYDPTPLTIIPFPGLHVFVQEDLFNGETLGLKVHSLSWISRHTCFSCSRRCSFLVAHFIVRSKNAVFGLRSSSLARWEGSWVASSE